VEGDQMNDLKPGMYQLRVDVKNPQADRRKTREWASEVTLKAGMRLRLRVCPDLAPRFEVLGQYGSVSRHSPLGEAILGAADPVEPTVKESLLIRDVWASDVLVRLVESGIVTLEQVEAVQKALEDELEAKEKGHA
jgi:hypothetical protein